MATPKKVPSRQRLIQAAATLFYEHGIHRTSVDAVVAAAGLTKPTFYKNFPSKDDLIVGVAQFRSQAWHEAVEAQVAKAKTPEQGLLAIFEFLDQFVRAQNFRGCALVNAAVEIFSPGDPSREVARANKIENRLRIERLAREANLRQPEHLAAVLALLFEGAITSAYVEQDIQAAEVAGKAAAQLIQAHASPTEKGPGPSSVP